MKQIFETLLQQLQEKELISEEQKAEYIESFDKGITEIKEGAFKSALDTVDEEHAKKFQESIDKIDEDHRAKLQALLEKIDDEHTKKLQDVVEAIDEDHGKKLQEIIEKVKNDIDEDHGAKLEEILEKIDEEHAEKLQAVIDKIDEDHTEKLKAIIKAYQDRDDAKITEQISDYLDLYLEEVKPEKEMADVAKIKRLEKMFEAFKEILVINDDKIQEEIKEAVLDGAAIIEEKDKEINRLMLEKVELNKKLKLDEAQKVLEEKIKECSPKLKAYLETTFKNADKETIEEKFDEAVQAFETEESDRRQQLAEDAKEGNKVQPKTVVTENLSEVRSAPTMMDMYANIIKKSIK